MSILPDFPDFNLTINDDHLKFIFRNLHMITEVLQQGEFKDLFNNNKILYEQKLTTMFKEFSIKCPSLFKKLIMKEDLSRLDTYFTQIHAMRKGHIDSDQAKYNVDSLMADQYLFKDNKHGLNKNKIMKKAYKNKNINKNDSFKHKNLVSELKDDLGISNDTFLSNKSKEEEKLQKENPEEEIVLEEKPEEEIVLEEKPEEEIVLEEKLQKENSEEEIVLERDEELDRKIQNDIRKLKKRLK
jgi:hypothetical protein